MQKCIVHAVFTIGCRRIDTARLTSSIASNAPSADYPPAKKKTQKRAIADLSWNILVWNSRSNWMIQPGDI